MAVRGVLSSRRNRASVGGPLKRLLVSLSLVAALATPGCAYYGQAKLPTDFFVTTGDLGSKPYQPVALVESRQMLCTPCGLTLEAAYDKIEASLKEELITKAKAAGANAIIDLKYEVMNLQFMSMVVLRGTAVKL